MNKTYLRGTVAGGGQILIDLDRIVTIERVEDRPDLVQEEGLSAITVYTGSEPRIIVLFESMERIEQRICSAE